MACDKSPSLVFLMEIKTNAKRMDWIKFKMGYKGCFTVNVIGRKSGLALLWKKDSNVELMSFSQRHISANVMDEELNHS